MTERGVDGTTLSEVARRAGVARATVYLRWPNRSALVGAVVRSAVGGKPLPMSGDLEDDIRRTARFIARIFAAPSFAALLPELVRGVLATPPELSFDAISPGRGGYGRQYADHAKAQGFDTTVDPALASDVMIGTSIGYLLATGHPMSEADATKLAEVLIRGLRVPARPETRKKRPEDPAAS